MPPPGIFRPSPARLRIQPARACAPILILLCRCTRQPADRPRLMTPQPLPVHTRAQPNPHLPPHTPARAPRPPEKRPPFSLNTYELFLPPEICPRKPHSDVALCTPVATLFLIPRLRSCAALAPPSRCHHLATSGWSERLRTLGATEPFPAVALGRLCGLITRQGARPGTARAPLPSRPGPAVLPQ